MKRKPLKITTFEDIEGARRYHRTTEKWAQNVSRSFVSVAEKWGIAGGKVLDVGTGTGLTAVGFAQGIPGVEVTGLDLSAVAIEVAGEYAQKSGLASRVFFEEGDAEEMPFEDGAFDLVISGSTLHLVNDPIRMFDEIRRVLKPGGRFFISDFRRSWLGLLSEHLRASYSPEEVREMLHQSKLQNWRVESHPFSLSILSEE
jgi:ubiquinone/menaquinone biosynthesis C-methylase UbiE